MVPMRTEGGLVEQLAAAQQLGERLLPEDALHFRPAGGRSREQYVAVMPAFADDLNAVLSGRQVAPRNDMCYLRNISGQTVIKT